VSLLIEFLDAVTTVMLGVESGGRAGRIARASDIDPFILRLMEIGEPHGIQRCGEDSLCQGDEVLVFAVEPLVTPEGKGLADVAVGQLETFGVVVERVEQPHASVLSIAGSNEGGWLEARVVAPRGWILVITTPSGRDSVLAELVDRAIAEIEGPSAR
jgi:hypothetical protein